MTPPRSTRRETAGRGTRALVTMHPAASHLDPVLPLLLELRSRDWEVAVAASPRFADVIRDRGLDFRPVGLPWLEARAAETFPELATMPLDQQSVWWVTDIFADRAAKPAATDLVDLIDDWQPDVVLRDYWEFGGWAAAEATDTPCAVIGIAMHASTEDVTGAIGERLREVRSHVGLPADGDLTDLYGARYIDLVPPRYQLNEPPDVVHLRPVPLPDSTVPPPSQLDRRRYEATVLVTFGTVFNRTPGIFETVIGALGDEPVNVLVTTGAGRDPSELGPLPDNTRVEEFVPHARVLPHCDAVVCHGGFGTTMAALAHGVPVVAVPLSADQPLHAARCQELGVGLHVPYPDLTPDRIRGAVGSALTDTELRRSAGELGADIRAMPDAARTADALEGWLLDR